MRDGDRVPSDTAPAVDAGPALDALSEGIRAPLFTLLGWTSLMRIGELERDRFGAAADAIDRSAFAHVELVDRLLDVARIHHRKLELRRERVDLTRPLSDACARTKRLLDAKRLQLSMDVPAGAVVMGDPERLTQIVVHLVTNAVQCTPERGAIALTLKSDRVRATVEVADTGRGIAVERLDSIFDCFAHARAEDAKRGLGLGLFLARALAELHGGQLQASSLGVGRGARFRLTLPRADGIVPVSPRGSIPRRR
ncbi:MAG: HAMP domain-containing sensor histidine kinase [Polyangiaceae bacterium]